MCTWLHTEVLEQVFKSKIIDWDGYFLDQTPIWTVLISFWVPLSTTYLGLWHAVHGKYIWYKWLRVRDLTQSNHHYPCSYSKWISTSYKVYPFLFPWASPSVPWDSFSFSKAFLGPWSVFYHCPLCVKSIPSTQLTQAIKQRSNGNNFSSLLTQTTSQMVILWCFRTYYWHPEICSLLETVVRITVKVISFSPWLYMPKFL